VVERVVEAVSRFTEDEGAEEGVVLPVREGLREGGGRWGGV